MKTTKTIISFALFLLIGVNVRAQVSSKTYWETHDPSPDSIINCKVTRDGGIYKFSSVDSIPNKTKEQLYNTAKEWIGRIYKNPKIVIKSENAPSQIVFEGQLTSSKLGNMTTESMHGRVELNFKDGRYKWTISDLSSHIDIMGSISIDPVERIPRYSMSRGERASKWLLVKLYDFLSSFKTMMQGQEDSDW